MNRKFGRGVNALGSGLLVLCLLSSSGCASTGRLEPTAPLSGKLGRYRTLVVHVSSEKAGTTEEMEQLEDSIVSRLREGRTFEKVYPKATSTNAAADLSLNARIVKLRKVSPEWRAMLGAFAGRAKILLDVQLVEPSSNKTLCSFRAEGKSSGGSIMAGTTSQAIDRAVEQIVEFIRSNRA